MAPFRRAARHRPAFQHDAHRNHARQQAAILRAQARDEVLRNYVRFIR